MKDFKEESKNLKEKFKGKIKISKEKEINMELLFILFKISKKGSEKFKQCFLKV